MNQRGFITDCIKRGVPAVIASHDANGRLFAYTIGMTKWDMPELILFGPRPEIANQLLNIACHLMKQNGPFKDNDTTDDIANLVTAFKSVSINAVEPYACQALSYYEKSKQNPTFLQMVVPDRKGILPWQDGFDAKHMDPAQPRLWEKA